MKTPYLKTLPLAALAGLVSLSATNTVPAAKIGINFQDDWIDDGGAAVTDTSFGIPASDWYNVPRYPNSEGAPFATSNTIPLPGGGSLLLEWSAINTYSYYAAIPTSPGNDPGADQVVYGYLDDSGTGYRVRLSGLRNSMADYKVTLIASSDSASGFTDASLAHSSGTDVIVYGVPDPGTVNSATGGVWAISPESPVISTGTENNTLQISGAPRSGSLRSTLAGFIIDYTPATANVPVIETQPVAPAGTIFVTGSFTLSASASGSPTLAYQWRKGSTNLPGQTSPTLAITNATVANSGEYSVVVSNGAGTAFSNPVTINISSLTQPVFTTTPIGQTFYPGYPATFTSLATGGDLTYSWKRGSTVLPGQTSATLNLPSITAADAGTYTVTATNTVGSASTSAVLNVTVPVPGSYEAVQAAQKPLLWYRYSETVLPVTDTSTAANTGSVGAAGNAVVKRYLPFQQPGALVGDPANKAAGVTLSSQFIDIPYHAGLNTPSFTAELWVKAPPTALTARFDPLINRGPAAGDGFLFFGGNGVTKWQFRTYNGTLRNQITSTVDIVPGAWTHLVGTLDADSNTQHFYVNGVEQGTGIPVTNGYTPNSTLPMRLGGFPNDNGNVGGGTFAGGGLDEVAIYPAALSAAEVLAHYQNATNSPARTVPYQSLVLASNPSGYWRMNDPAGPTPPSPRNSGTAGSAWNGTYGGDMMPAAPGPQPPESPGFEATNASVQNTANGYNAVPPLNITSNTITVTTWLKRAERFNTTDDLSWPAWLGAGGGFHLDGTNGRPYGELRYHWDGSQWSWGSGLQVPAEIWTFCAMVLEPTKVTMYMSDGLNLLKSGRSDTHTPHVMNQAMAFAGNQAGRTTRNYVGKLDESAVYNRALSEAEVFTLFLKGTGASYGMDIASADLVPDSKPAGLPRPGINKGVEILPSSTDALPVTRTGVGRFDTNGADQIVIPPGTGFDAPTGTIAFWMNAPLPTTVGEEAAILFDRRTSTGTVISVTDAGNLFIQCSGGTNTYTTAAIVADHLWHHIAVTYDQSAGGGIAVYVDGTAVGTNANAGAWTWPAGQPIELGKSHDEYWRTFAGDLDDFRFYSRILTEAEIASLKTTSAVIDPATLQVRYDFSPVTTPGLLLTWPLGILEQSPSLGVGEVWSAIPGATSPWPVDPAGPRMFYRSKLP